jgi:hypothetical protein
MPHPTVPDIRPPDLLTGRQSGRTTGRFGGWLTVRWRQLRDRGGESGGGGGMSLVLVLVTFALIVCTGLVVDGGAKAAGLDRATRLATEAARSGLQVANLPTGQVPEVAATEEVNRYLGLAGVTGSTRVEGSQVVVTVTLTGSTKLLSLMGVNSWTVTGTGRADGLYTP